MALKEQVRKDMISATKSRDLVALSTLRMLLASLKNKEIELRSDIDDDDVVKVISTMIKQRKESIDLYEKGGRKDLADKEREEMEVLRTYLPPEIDREELLAIIEGVVEEVGASGLKDMGTVMKNVMPRVTGRADGKEVSEIVKEILQRK